MKDENVVTTDHDFILHFSLAQSSSFIPHPSSLILLARLHDFFNRAGHIESLFGQIVVFAFDDFFEAFDRVFQLAILTFAAGKLPSNVKRLRKELLDLARALNYQLVFIRQFVQPEDRNDVLQILVALQDLFDLLRGVVMIFADDARIEDAG